MAQKCRSATCTCVDCNCTPDCKCEPSKAKQQWTNPFVTFRKLFFREKFVSHRLVGLAYLIQYAVSWYLLLTDVSLYHRSQLWWTVPLTGFVQAIIAAATFTFLPKAKANPGYYGDKSSMSYAFVCENIFFSGLLLFQSLYMSPLYDSYISQPQFLALECLGVFLPYTMIRPLFPKTHFRDTSSTDNSRSEANKRWYELATFVTALFYLFAKHFIGLYLNYVRFLDRVPIVKDGFAFHFMLLSGGAATTISMFLHTLRFKGYLQGKTSFTLYMISYTAAFISWWFLRHILTSSLDVIAVALLGLLINRFGPVFRRFSSFDVYQVCVCAFFVARRYGFLSAALSGFLPMGAAKGVVQSDVLSVA